MISYLILLFSFVVILNCDIDIIKYLLDNGADKATKDNNGFDFYKHCQLSKINYSEFECTKEPEIEVEVTEAND